MKHTLRASVAGLLVGLGTLGVHAWQQQEDEDRKVAGGGINVPGWQGKIDDRAAEKGMTVADSKFTRQGDALHLTTGPAAIYWNPQNTAKGDYSVKATFREAKADPRHPHPYGIFIGGNQLNTGQQSFVYCVAYGGSGDFLVRQFNGSTVTTLAKRQPHDAVKKPGPDGSVTNEVGWNVRGDRAECVINGTAVTGFNKSELLGDGKLESTDGIYGIRVSHNVDLAVTDLGLARP